MLKNLKKIKDKLNNKMLLLGVMATSSFATATNDSLSTTVLGGQSTAKGFLKSIVTENHFINIMLQVIIIGIILYAIFNIAKEFLSGQGQQGSIWKNLGAILFAALLYYLLFIKIAGS